MINNYLEIGKICNTFGLKGELKVVSESDFIDYRFQVGKVIYIKYGSKYIEKNISSMRIIKGNPCITLDSMFDINLVQEFVGASIYCDKDDIPPLKQGEYLIDDLVGKEVYYDDNVLIGTIYDVIILPKNKVLEIKNTNNETILVPFIKDFIVSVSDKIIIKHYEVENA